MFWRDREEDVLHTDSSAQIRFLPWTMGHLSSQSCGTRFLAHLMLEFA